MWSPESAYAEFSSRVDALKALDLGVNEANTRLRIIDTVLFDVLLWEKGEIDAEKFCREVGYADYALCEGSTVACVLEAKKAGVAFLLKTNKLECKPVPFGLLASECPTARAALQQALGYAASLGARYIGITNGTQWLFTLTFVPNQPIEERPVIVFDSLDRIKENFRLFWDCFSRDGITQNRIHEQLVESRKKPAPSKLCMNLPGYPVLSRRNVYANELSYILRIVWDVLAKVETTHQFIENCYVTTVSDDLLINYAEHILKTRIDADAKYSETSVQHTSKVEEVLKVGFSDKPFVLLGEVGHGKSTFLHYLRLVAAKNILANYVQMELNFLDRPDGDTEVNDYIYKEVEAQLNNRAGIDIYEDSVVRGVLYTEFKRFKLSALYKLYENNPERQKQEEERFISENIKDRHSYFTKVFRYLKRGQKKSIALYFDNLDRRNDKIQEEAFLKASSIARDWECVVFICLRPETFYKSLKKGVLDSLAPKTFTVGSPDLTLVLKRRFEFARSVALGEEHMEDFAELFAVHDISLKLPNVAEIFSCCEFSVRKGASAIEMLSALSNGDIRLLIDLTRNVLTSNHLDTRKIINRIRESGEYHVSDFEAVKTLLYGDYDQYSPGQSLFVNIFDTFHADEKEHFIRMLTLEHLNRLSQLEPEFKSVRLSNLNAHLQSFYFDALTVRRHLKVLSDSKCIDIYVFVSEGEALHERVRITTRGQYHINNLVYVFQYLDAMIIDTPIMDAVIRNKINLSLELSSRINNTMLFIDYLESALKALHDVQGQRVCGEILARARENVSAIVRRDSRGRN